MTTYDKQTLKTYFQTGDVPTGADYGNLIDSQVNVAETSAQSMLGKLIVPEVIASRVSCGNIAVTGTFSAATFNVGSLVTNTVSAGSVYANTFGVINTQYVSARDATIVSGLDVGGMIRASGVIRTSAGITSYGSVTFQPVPTFNNAFYIYSGLAFHPGGTAVATTSAAGTNQGAAATVSASNCVTQCAGVANGVTTGFILQANNTGCIQYLFNPSTSANLYPPSGGQINALGANNPYPLTAGSLTTVIHMSATIYGASS